MKVLILSDIHGNWPALQAVLAAEPDVGQILCLGDIVNYGPQPAPCLSWAMKTLRPGWLLQGNHDRAVALDDDPHCSPAYQLVAEATQQAVSSRAVTGLMKKFLAALKPEQTFHLDGAKCVACHASPSDPLYHYITEKSSMMIWESELVRAGHPDLLFLGHTHLPMKTQFQRTLVVNPGSLGQPKHGDPRAAYAVWENGRVTLRPVPYDVEQTVRAYDGLGLEPHVVEALCTVLRTGCDLPEQARRPVIYVSSCNACELNSSVAQWIPWLANYNGENSQTGNPWNTCTSCEVWGSGVWDVWQCSSSAVVPGVPGATSPASISKPAWSAP